MLLCCVYAFQSWYSVGYPYYRSVEECKEGGDSDGDGDCDGDGVGDGDGDGDGDATSYISTATDGSRSNYL